MTVQTRWLMNPSKTITFCAKSKPRDSQESEIEGGNILVTRVKIMPASTDQRDCENIELRGRRDARSNRKWATWVSKERSEGKRLWEGWRERGRGRERERERERDNE